MPGLDGCGGVAAILIDQLLIIAFFGEKDHSPHAVYLKNDLDKEAKVGHKFQISFQKITSA